MFSFSDGQVVSCHALGWGVFCALLSALVLLVPGLALSLEKPGENLKEIGLSTELGTDLDLTLTFTDQLGQAISLREVLSEDKPNILIPAYYDCPRLCGLLLDRVSELLPKLNLRLGEDFRAITVSFNPEDEASDAKRVHEQYALALPDSVGDRAEWRFLAGDNSNIVPLMNSLGFLYKEDRGEFAHTAAIFVVTPGGKISQYFAGISFPFRDVRLSLVEASEGKVGTLFDQALLYCFRFDPSQGKYTWAAFNMVRAGGGLTFIFLFGLIYWLRKREKSKLST